MRNTLFAGLLGAALAPSTALACGGFFCQQEEMDQAGEQIVFAMTPEGRVEMHVQITYAGAADEFAWIVPTPTEPDPFLSTDQLFNGLSLETRPSFSLDYDIQGCHSWDESDSDTDTDGDTDTDSDADSDTDGPSVVVISTEMIGSYVTTTLQANDSGALLEWLQTNGYQVPSAIQPKLDPYIADHSYFVAIKLETTRSTGTIAPLGLRFDATSANIPIQLTSIAATPDMRLEVYFFGENRAVPDNYLHVQVDDASVEWFRGGDNYPDLITRAADEAGGHAFATDFAGDPGAFGWRVIPTIPSTNGMSGITDPVDFMDAIISRGFKADALLLDLLMKHIPKPSSVTASDTQFYNCLGCYAAQLQGQPFDAAAFVADLETFIVEPLENAAHLFEDYPKLTRLTSSVSPEEMTLDPHFVQNPDMGDVSNWHTATATFDCTDMADPESVSYTDVPFVIELSDGRLLQVEQTLSEIRQQGSLIWGPQGAPRAAVVIEETSASGQPNVIADYTDELPTELPDPGTTDEEGGDGKTGATGCGGCQGTGDVGTVGLLAMVAFAFRRRR